jgi:hypothetical protein
MVAYLQRLMALCLKARVGMQRYPIVKISKDGRTAGSFGWVHPVLLPERGTAMPGVATTAFSFFGISSTVLQPFLLSYL